MNYWIVIALAKFVHAGFLTSIKIVVQPTDSILMVSVSDVGLLAQKYNTTEGLLFTWSFFAYSTTFVFTEHFTPLTVSEILVEEKEIFGDGNAIVIPLVEKSISLPGLKGNWGVEEEGKFAVVDQEVATACSVVNPVLASGIIGSGGCFKRSIRSSS